jgi:hypothetical protein
VEAVVLQGTVASSTVVSAGSKRGTSIVPRYVETILPGPYGIHELARVLVGRGSPDAATRIVHKLGPVAAGKVYGIDDATDKLASDEVCVTLD